LSALIVGARFRKPSGEEMGKQSSFLARAFRIVGFGCLAFAITALAGVVWTGLLIANLRENPSVPWSIPVMAFLLWLAWKYLGGMGWPHSTSAARRRYLRPECRPPRIYFLALIAGVFSVVALAGYWIVLFQLVKMSPNAIPDMSRYPRLTVALILLMASLVAPFMEEASFRGYFQVVLEQEFRGSIAVIISAAAFALAHFTQGLFWPKLFVYFLAGVTFGTIAYLTQSTLPAIPCHIIGDLTFFLFVWPRDASRHSGADRWFWIHVMQAAVFTVLAVWAFRHLAKQSTDLFAQTSVRSS
jgi:membrane protease YdiL (CAAX protease family)